MSRGSFIWETLEANMEIEIRAPSTMVLVVSLGLAVFALIYFFMADDVSPAFWMAIMAYVVAALGTTVKT
jgi:hypothetical protein